MNKEIEKEHELIGGLLINLNDIENIDIRPKWFINLTFGKIVAAIQEAPKKDLLSVSETISQLYPELSIGLSELSDIAAGQITSSYNNDLAIVVHRQYLKRELARATEAYSKSYEKELFNKIQYLNEQLEDLEFEIDEGTLESSVNEFMDELKNGSPQGLLSFSGFDKLLGNGIQGGQLIVIGARPAVGKTAFAINMCEKISSRNKDMRIDFFNLEMTQKHMLKRFISRISGVSSYKLRDVKTLNKKEKEKVAAASLDTLSMGVNVYDHFFYLDQIANTIRKNARKSAEGKYIVFIDYLTLIQVRSKMDMRFKVGEITRTLKKLTNEYNIPIVLLAQLNRGLESRTGEDKKPRLSDLRESGDIEQDANVVGFLYNTDVENDQKIQLTIQKNREGITADIDFNFFKQRMEFSEVF